MLPLKKDQKFEKSFVPLLHNALLTIDMKHTLVMQILAIICSSLLRKMVVAVSDIQVFLVNFDNFKVKNL
jgi:hypothetical protein